MQYKPPAPKVSKWDGMVHAQGIVPVVWEAALLVVAVLRQVVVAPPVPLAVPRVRKAVQSHNLRQNPLVSHRRIRRANRVVACRQANHLVFRYRQVSH